MEGTYTDRYDLPLSTTSQVAAAHYIEGIDRALALNMGSQASLEAALAAPVEVQRRGMQLHQHPRRLDRRRLAAHVLARQLLEAEFPRAAALP